VWGSRWRGWRACWRATERAALEKAEASEARREGRPYAIALCDVDHFGRYNNRYLYHNGNRVLRELADAMSAVCRPLDVVFRYGGEELAVVLPDTELCDAATLAERLRCAVEELQIPHDNRPPPHHVTSRWASRRSTSTATPRPSIS
jgi:diguanylate cyclase (GGDEF)-like protein